MPKLNRSPDQRKALLRGLTNSAAKCGRIKTMRARANATRKHVDKIITVPKDGSFHKRKQALGYIDEKNIVPTLFAEVHKTYKKKNGEYTKIISNSRWSRGGNAVGPISSLFNQGYTL